MFDPLSSSPAAVPGPQPPDARGLTDRIMWFALLLSHGFYAFMIQVVSAPHGGDAATGGELPLSLVGAALMFAALALAVDALLLGEAQVDKWITDAQASSQDEASVQTAIVARVLSFSIVRWGLADVVSVFGVIAALQHPDAKNRAFLFVAVGVGVHLICRPKMTRFLQQVAARTPKAIP